MYALNRDGLWIALCEEHASAWWGWPISEQGQDVALGPEGKSEVVLSTDQPQGTDLPQSSTAAARPL